MLGCVAARTDERLCGYSRPPRLSRLNRMSVPVLCSDPDRTILVEAARQRATLGMRMPDAIHVATALAAGCDAFLTNDRRLRLPPTIARHLI